MDNNDIIKLLEQIKSLFNETKEDLRDLGLLTKQTENE